MCLDKDENKVEHQSLGSFWNLSMTNELILQCIIVRVFVLAHEQPISCTGISTSFSHNKCSYCLHTDTVKCIWRKGKKLDKTSKCRNSGN